MSTQTVETMPEILSRSMQDAGLGIDVPGLNYNSRNGIVDNFGTRTLAIIAAVGAISGTAAHLGFNTEKANSQETTPTNTCTIPTGEESVNLYPGTVSGLDMTVDTIALDKTPCVGQEVVATTYIRNRSSETIAQPITIRIDGTLGVIDSITRIELNDQEIPIAVRGEDPINMGDRLVEKYGGLTYDSTFDRNRRLTKVLFYGRTFWDSVLQDDVKKVEVFMTPKRAVPITPFPGGDYIEISSNTFQSPGDINDSNNGAVSNFEVRTADGISLPPIKPPIAVNACEQVSSTIAASKPVNGKGTIRLRIKSNGPSVNGFGNGASKNSRERRSSSRAVITVGSSTRTPKLPKWARRIGNRIYVDVPKGGIRKKGELIRSIGYGSNKSAINPRAKLLIPVGKLPGCKRAVAAVSTRR